MLTGTVHAVERKLITYHGSFLKTKPDTPQHSNPQDIGCRHIESYSFKISKLSKIVVKSTTPKFFILNPKIVQIYVAFQISCIPGNDSVFFVLFVTLDFPSLNLLQCLPSSHGELL